MTAVILFYLFTLAVKAEKDLKSCTDYAIFTKTICPHSLLPYKGIILNVKVLPLPKHPCSSHRHCVKITAASFTTPQLPENKCSYVMHIQFLDAQVLEKVLHGVWMNTVSRWSWIFNIMFIYVQSLC
jgi:hypothetical protein